MKILTDTIDVKFSPEEWETLKIIVSDWRQMVRNSNRYGDDVQSSDMNEFIHNVMKIDKDTGCRLLDAEILCMGILNREKNA